MELTICSKSGCRVVESSPSLRCATPVLALVYRHREIELVLGGFQVDEEVVDFVEHRSRRARPERSILLSTMMGSSFALQRLLQHVARLRQRAFAGVHQEQDAIHHAQRALHFTAKIAVTRRVHDVDFDVVVKQCRCSWREW